MTPAALNPEVAPTPRLGQPGLQRPIPSPNVAPPSAGWPGPNSVPQPEGALRRPSLSAARTMPLHSPTEGTSRVRPRGCDRPTNPRGERTAKPTGETTVPASSAATGPSVGRPCRLSYSYLETNASCWLELPIRLWKLKNKREANVRLLQPAGRAL